MFERYTDPARRALFFSRYEASVLGGLAIETEHLLLGILRDQRQPVLTHMLATMNVTAEALRASVYARISPDRTNVDTSVEIPFSKDAKQVLEYSAEEASILLHPHIGTEHLLLGLLRLERGLAWDVLREKGLSITPVREALVMYVSATSAPPPEIAGMISGMVAAMRSRVEHVEGVPRSAGMYIMTVLENTAPGRRAVPDESRAGVSTTFGHVEMSTPADRPLDGRTYSIGPITMSAATLPQLALLLEPFLGGPVIVLPDGALHQQFDIELQGKYDTPEALVAALRDQLGLVLTKGL